MGRTYPRGFTLVTLGTIAVLLAVTLASVDANPASADPRVQTFDTFDTNQPYIALTFDVTFDRGDGEQILDTLRSRGVRATFAITGLWAQSNPDLIQRMVAEGHQLMNHTWTHTSMTGEFTGSNIHEPRSPLSRDQVIDELRRTENLIQTQVGVDMKPYVRPPYGDYDDYILSAMADAGYTYNIMWTADTFGWYVDPVDVVTQRALDAAQPGANILMHVGHDSTDGAALPGIIDGLRNMGYEFATVAEFVEGDLAAASTRYFPETGREVSGDFLRFWNNFGGQELFGLPVSGEIEEDGMTVQYFESARFEHHPDSRASTFNVELSRLGAELKQDQNSSHVFQPSSRRSSSNCTYFAETRQSVCGEFRSFWERFVGTEVFGYPISREFRRLDPDTGETVTVQYFERQVLERHRGEQTGTDTVLLADLGEQAFAASRQDSPVVTQREPRVRGWPEVINRQLSILARQD